VAATVEGQYEIRQLSLRRLACADAAEAAQS
jgi:hypothetical protein